MKRLCLAAGLVLAITCAPQAHAADDGTTFREVLTAMKAPAPDHRQVLTRTYGVDHPNCCRPWKERIRWIASIYAWLPDVSGVTWDDGVRSEFDVPFSSIDSITESGWVTYVEARKGKWFFALDFIYGNLREGGTILDGTLLGIDAEVRVQQWFLDVYLGYRIWSDAMRFSGGCGTCVTRCRELYAFAGGRYSRNEVTLTSRVRFGPAMTQRRTTTVEERFDPFVGVKFAQPLGCRWTLGLRLWGMIESENLWHTQGQLLVDYRFARRWHAYLGVRSERMESSSGSGATKNGIRMLKWGPVIGVGFTF